MSHSPAPASLAAAADITIRALPTASPEGADPLPRLEVSLRTAGGATLVREAIAAAPLARGVVWADFGRRLYLLEVDGRERLIAPQIGGRPIADPQGRRAAWSEPLEGGAAARLRVLEGEAPVTLAALPGPMAPVAWTERGIVLVGAAAGGVAGVWIVGPGAGQPRCLTNCALRTAESWGDAYLPPPGDPASIRIDGRTLRYTDAEGIERETALAGVTP